MSGKARPLIAGAAAASLLVLTGLYAARMAQESPLAEGSADRTVVVQPGDSLNTVVGQLEEQNILARPLLFKLAAFATRASGRIQAGEYRIREGDTHSLLLERMVQGEVVQHYFTIIEGWTVRELLEALSNENLLLSTIATHDPVNLAHELNMGYPHAEGWFFPDTYAYTRGETDADLLLRAHHLMEKRLMAAWEQRAADLPFDDPYEALILASIGTLNGKQDWMRNARSLPAC